MFAYFPIYQSQNKNKYMLWPDCQRGPIINRSTRLQSGRPVYKRVDPIINFLKIFDRFINRSTGLQTPWPDYQEQ